MNTESLNQLFQYLAWIISLVELILGLYILLLNPKHIANRYVSIFLLLISANTYASGLLVSAGSFERAVFPSVLIALTTPILEPLLLMVSFVLLMPARLKTLWRYLRWVVLIILILPLVLGGIDLLFDTGLWYTGIKPEIYLPGFLPFEFYTAGSLRGLVIGLNIGVCSLATLFLLIYVVIFDKSITSVNKRLAWLLLGTNAFTVIIQFAFQNILPFLVLSLSSSTLFAITYGYAGFQQMISERRTQPGKLQARLTLLILIIAIPLLVAMTLILTNQTQKQLEANAVQSLENANQYLSANIETWLTFNLRALETLASDADIISMDPNRQKPLLVAMANSYPEMYLVSTTDLNGMNVARNDDQAPKDYSDRVWFQSVRDGAEVTYQTLKGRTSGQPALVVSVPIKNNQNRIVGVAMFASDLDDVTNQVRAARIGDQGYAFVVDQKNQVVAHPDQSLTAEITDVSSYPSIQQLREGKSGLISFKDDTGVVWRAYVGVLENGWGVVVQQPESELFAPIRQHRQLAVLMVLLGVALLSTMTWATIYQAIRPIHNLTETAAYIIAGDLGREARVETEDELGVLAQTFNNMTAQLRNLIGGLETRVAERTQALQKRALQLQVTAEVAREAASIRDLERLLDHVVKLISDRFGFYHAGIFFLSHPALDTTLSGDRGSEERGYAVLRAASSEGGKRMLARGHKLKVGEVGIVGYVAAMGKPRIALDVGADAVFFDNPDLPLTRSEMALPLKVQNRVIGVLDVQSTEPGAFTPEDVETLQVLADQVALAIDNARLLSESQQAYQELQSLLGRQTVERWKQYLKGQRVTYLLDPTGVKIVRPDEKREISTSDEVAKTTVPIELRGQQIGTFVLNRPSEMGSWTPEENELIRATLSQVALSLENVRLLDEVQNRANQEELINLIVSRAQSSLNLETVMKTAVQEIGRAVNVSKVQIRLSEKSVEGEA